MTYVRARVRAQGKINLGLRVLARETSGYHQLETVFARLALADDILLDVGVREQVVLVHGAELGPPRHNLAWRAAALYMEWRRWPSGFRIEITKRIPVGGGLGGGSADAAAVLRALNALAPDPVASSELLDMAAALGADVPFLTTELPMALAWGRGERMLALEAPVPRTVLLVVPPFPVPTAEAFGWLAHAREDRAAAAPCAAVHQVADASRWSALASFAGNDLEAPVRQQHPELADVLDMLRARLHPLQPWVGMTGSGSTLFVVAGDDDDPAMPAVPAGWQVVRTTAPATAAAIEMLD